MAAHGMYRQVESIDHSGVGSQERGSGAYEVRPMRDGERDVHVRIVVE